MRVCIGMIAFALVIISAGTARADIIDDSFQRGTSAAAKSDWDAAVEAFEAAARHLPGTSALLSYNLGTAFAHRGDLGRATLHLERALDPRSAPPQSVAEAARRNLEVVRARVELRAATQGTRVDRPQTWWDLFVEALRAPAFGWASLALGWSWLALLAGHRFRIRRREGSVLGAALLVLGIAFGILAFLHGGAIRADVESPPAIVVEQVDAREGPSLHRKIGFTLEAGAKVRVIERSPGWLRVRLPGGLEGWVHEGAAATLRPSSVVRRASGPASGASTEDTSRTQTGARPDS